MRLTRRHFLAAAALTTVALPTGVAVHWWEQPADAPYVHLSAAEARFMDAIAEATFPAGGTPALGGGAAGVARYMDLILSGMVGTQRSLVRAGMHAVDHLSVVTHGDTFSGLVPEAAQAQLRSWLASDIAPLRGLVQSLYLFAAMAYVAHPEVAPLLRPWFGCGFGR